METRKRRLARSTRNRMVAGVCGGIAEWQDWDPTVVRLVYILVSVLSAAFPGVLIYLILWLVTPPDTAVTQA
ncbi:MAG: PspC domain-containing protein [Gammaproteobacteria bacterium PRO9]|nr:PspC domain-containing protein [Gammaproteobacteria bacterium PRO9]